MLEREGLLMACTKERQSLERGNVLLVRRRRWAPGGQSAFTGDWKFAQSSPGNCCRKAVPGNPMEETDMLLSSSGSLGINTVFPGNLSQKFMLVFYVLPSMEQMQKSPFKKKKKS